MGDEDVVLEPAELEVVCVVREEVEGFEWLGVRGEDGREVGLEESLCSAAESDEVGPDRLDSAAELRHVDWVRRHASEDKLGEECVHVLGRA